MLPDKILLHLLYLLYSDINTSGSCCLIVAYIGSWIRFNEVVFCGTLNDAKEMSSMNITKKISVIKRLHDLIVYVLVQGS